MRPMHSQGKTPILEEKMCYNALSHEFGGAYESIKKSLKNHGSACAAWNAEKSSESAKKLWGPLVEDGIALHLATDESFPKLLREMPWPPFALYTKGDTPTSTLEGIAVVGTRNATPEGKKIAREFAKSIARYGIPVVSGLALGIDGEAHKGAMEAHGKTIAVLPCGLNRVYPRTHDRLAKDILSSGGMLVSEYPYDAPIYLPRFIERNRLVSALSKGVIVVEAPEGSGALATARFALEQNREVFVVPGPVQHANYVGSHALIRAGATLVRNIDDVWEAWGILPSEKKAPLPLIPAGLDETKKAILNCLHTHGPLLPDKIAELTSLPIERAQQEIALLVVEEMLTEKVDGSYMLKI